MKPFYIYAITCLYSAQSVQLFLDGQRWPAALCLCYALAGVPLIFMVQH